METQNNNMTFADLEPEITLIFLFGIMCWLMVLSVLLPHTSSQSEENSEGNHYWIDY